ncbi:NAD(P)H-dependent oxidoreductase [Pedobacter sp.]|uniref:NAD(P)H-dependent oxidoreductase n=1 Tax=Pedobacter sp. TaxID=1411316 RepID=UPI003D7FF909
MSLIQALNWRYATKKMNGKAVSQDKVDQIIKAAHLAPTSSGLQPFKIIVVTNPDLKAKIADLAYGQQQVIDCSHLLIFAAWNQYTEKNIREVFAYANAERGLPSTATADYENTLISSLTAKTAEDNYHHAAKQAYIGFGMAIAEAALLQIDATPMEGFDAGKLDELLNLKALNLRSAVMLTLGYRDENGDWLVNLKKVRSPLTEFVVEY